MSNHSPIPSPPPELVDKWVNQSPYINPEGYIATQAVQWGADQELEACCLWMERNFDDWDNRFSDELRAIRRPKPPSLKEQALKMLAPLSNPVMPGTPEYRLYEPQAEIIRRALEQLDG